MTATLIQRMSKNLQSEAARAASKIELDGYTVSDDGKRIYDDEGGFYEVLYYRCGEEVIAVADFYLDEEGCSIRGSQDNWYELNGDTLTRE